MAARKHLPHRDSEMRIMKLPTPLLALCVMVVLAGPAHGEPGSTPPGEDPAFLASLQHAGIGYNDPGQAIAAAKAVCGLVDGGKSGLDVLNRLKTANPEFTMGGAAQFAAIAASSYCPQQLSGGDADK